MSETPRRLPRDAAHGFGGGAVDRDKPIRFRINGQTIDGFVGDSVLSAALASGIESAGTDGEMPIALSESFAPPIAREDKPDQLFPMERTPAIDGARFITLGTRPGPSLRKMLRRDPGTLGHRFDGGPLGQPFSRVAPSEVIAADVAVVGGGVAGLSAAVALAAAGRKVVLIERRPHLGGHARYFGAVGNDETPEAMIERLAARLASFANATLLLATEAYDISGGAVIAHRVIAEGDRLISRSIAIGVRDIVLATGAIERLPVFAGNRLPGVVGASTAHARAERYGLWRGRAALVATQGNAAYRLARRVHDAGIAITRIADTRLGAQSRFIDFAKATGFTLSAAQMPVAVSPQPGGGMLVTLRGEGGNEQQIALPFGQLIVAGAWQPDLSLWMRAGGAIHWNGDSGTLGPVGHLDHMVLAGSATGIETLKATALSGEAAAAQILGKPGPEVQDERIEAVFETPDAMTAISPIADGRQYLDMGPSLILRPAADASRRIADDARPLGLGDVAAAVQLGLIAPDDAGVIAEERGMSGGAIEPQQWTGLPEPALGAAAPYLAMRFGPDPVAAWVKVDATRKFETGALIYANTAREWPGNAVGVITGPAPAGKAGGTALLSRQALEKADRFVIRTSQGAAPLRIGERLGEAKPAG